MTKTNDKGFLKEDPQENPNFEPIGQWFRIRGGSEWLIIGNHITQF